MTKKTLAEATGTETPSDSVLTAPWPYLLAGVIVLAAGAWSMLGENVETSQSEAAHQQARQASAQMGRVVQEIREMLRSDAVQDLARRVHSGEAQTPRLLSEMRQQIPEVTEVRIYDNEVFMTDFGDLGENNFILLDMLASALENQLSPVQMIQDDSLSHVAAASTIGRAVQEQGFVVAYLDPGTLLDAFDVPDPAAGYIALEHQTGANAPAGLREVGAGLPAGFVARRLPVPDSLFQVVYPGIEGSGLIGPREQVLLILFGVLLLIVGLVRRIQLRPPPSPAETMPEHFTTLQKGQLPEEDSPPTLKDARLRKAGRGESQDEAAEAPPIPATAAKPKAQPRSERGDVEVVREAMTEEDGRLRPEPDELPSRVKADDVPGGIVEDPEPVSPRPEDRRVAPPDLSTGGPPLVGRISQPADDGELDLSPSFSSGAVTPPGESETGSKPASGPGPAPPTEERQAGSPAGDTSPAAPAPATTAPVSGAVELKSEIFRAYDIRGIVGKSLDRGVAYQIGQAIGSEALDRLATPVVVGRDGRHSGPELVEGLIEGMQAAGCDVIDIGAVPTGVLYFAAHELGKGSGVMVTGSHNPPDYNGFKTMLGGHTLAGDDIFGLFERIRTGRLGHGAGQRSGQDAIAPFVKRITGDIQLKRPLKVVADCGNGIGGVCAVEVLQGIGAEVVPLFDDVDGDFPNHHPDPSEPKNLKDLIESVEVTKADLGLAFDGDADRLGVVTPDGSIVFSDRIMMLYAREVLGRKPGSTIIYDVKCTGHLDTVIREAGGVPEMYKTGHSLMKNRMKEVGAPLAGEMSGHFFFEDRWYGFDCGIYSACRLLEILASKTEAPETVLSELPNSVSTPELKVELQEGENHAFIEAFKQRARFPGARINVIDGVRADFADGWGLVRASNTTPILVLRFDADSDQALHNVKEAFRAQLLAVKPDLVLPF
jgi:phosphomannomutase